MIDHLVLSTNDDPRYYGFWPVVSQAWKKLFPEVSLVLAYISYNEDRIPELEQYGKVIHYYPIDGIPIQNQAKVSRMFVMSLLDGFVMMNDIDIMPLSRKYTEYCCDYLEKDKITCIGTDTYDGSPEEGKFPISYFCGDASAVAEVVNPEGLTYTQLLRSWIGMKDIDHKEDISRNIDPENPDCFSDESLIRALINRWDGKDTRVNRVPRKLTHGGNALCRANWKLDKNLLQDGYYKHAHLPRKNNKDCIGELMNYINTL